MASGSGVRPRMEPECQQCGSGRYEYVRQDTDVRGDVVSIFECAECGHEVEAV